MRLSFVSRFLALVALSVFPGWGASTDSLIHQVESRYNGARTLSLHFVENFEFQRRQYPPEVGQLTLRKQGKMRWDYTQPAGKLFISDGKTVYLYTAADNRVERIPVRDTADLRAPMAFLLGHLELKKEFRDFTSRPGDGGTWLDAKAKSDKVPYELLAMLVGENGTVKQLKVTGRDGSVMDFRFSDERLNPPVKNKLFHFEIPPGAEVVDAVEFSGEGAS